MALKMTIKKAENFEEKTKARMGERNSPRNSPHPATQATTGLARKTTFFPVSQPLSRHQHPFQHLVVQNHGSQSTI